MSLDAAKLLALAVLRQVMEEKLTPSNIECGVVTATTKQFAMISDAELVTLVEKLPPPETHEK